MKVLLIEDDHKLSDLMKAQIVKQGIAVDTVFTGEDGLFLASENNYDCLILDINLPDISGFEVCKQLRAQKVITPILIITARDAVSDRIKGLDLGADDYVTKPIDAGELLARIRALIRRSSKEPLPLLTVADLTIDPAKQLVKRGDKQIDLNPKEFAVLEFLARHSDEIVTRSMIMDHVWGSDFETLSNVVDVYIRYLRRKIDNTGKKILIHTIRGGGYSLSDKR
jgi:DNA-binding response OmpR family regulator